MDGADARGSPRTKSGGSSTTGVTPVGRIRLSLPSHYPLKGTAMVKPRTTIAHPLTIDLSFDPTVQPLTFAFQPARAPDAGATVFPDGHFSREVSGGLTELNLRLDAAGEAVKDTLGVFYIVTAGPNANLLMTCLDEVPETFFTWASGADFGDKIVPLMATHWPELHRQLLASQDTSMQERLLGTFITAQKSQWVVVDPLLNDAELAQVGPQQAFDLLVSAADTFAKVSNPWSLPGLVLALGSPDRLSRRRTGVADVLNGIGDVGRILSGGITASDASDIAQLFMKAWR